MTWVHNQIYAAGGGHIPRTWNDFAGQTGVTAVLHLRPTRPAAFCGQPPLAFLWLNVAEEGSADLETRWLAGQFLLSCVRLGQRVLLHSSIGRHRTRWAFVAYGICAGRSVQAALRSAAKRPWLSPYPTDEALWLSFADMVRERQKAAVA